MQKPLCIDNQPRRHPIPIEELGITPQKQRLLKLRLDGYIPKQIAHLTNLNEGTINNHFSQIFRKYDANSLLDFLIKVGWARVISNQTYLTDPKGNKDLTTQL